MIVALTCASCRGRKEAPPTVFEISEQWEQWTLTKNGEPFFVKGAVALRHLEQLSRCGGNAIRVWRQYETGLDQAREQGLYVKVSLPVGAERNGMDWNDTAMVENNIAEVMEIVEKYKNHPSLMLWGIGNEIDWIPPGIPYNPKLWDWVEEIARRIKETDPNHPVMTVIGDSDFDRKTREIAIRCPSLDLLGINLYGDFSDKVDILNRNWGRAYMVTEWGPHGHWMRPYTEWKAPMEESSSEKAATYRHSYTGVILQDPSHCLGSFVFLWGQKQEITHTWYGMFGRDGTRSEAVEVMQELWSGKAPGNRAPRVEELFIDGRARAVNLYLAPGMEYTAELVAHDGEDELSWAWEIKAEVEPAPYAGQGEVPAEPIPGLIEDAGKAKISFKAPGKEGAYRLFAYAYDGKGNWGYANYPFYVRSHGPD